MNTRSYSVLFCYLLAITIILYYLTESLTNYSDTFFWLRGPGLDLNICHVYNSVNTLSIVQYF